jgi:hypothetical protein
MMLGQFGPFFLDGDATSPEDLVVGILVLRRRIQTGLGFDHGLGGVVHTAEEVTVSMHLVAGGEEPVEGSH